MMKRLLSDQLANYKLFIVTFNWDDHSNYYFNYYKKRQNKTKVLK